jgi:hypothetical protein
MKAFYILIFLIPFFCKADEIISPNLNKNNVDVVIDEDYKNLQWNRYVLDNFTILSIDDKQGLWFYKNLKYVKNWCLNRWGISNYDLKEECRIMIVPDKKMFKRFFNLEKNHIEFREKDDKIQIIAVWLCLDDEKDQFNEIPKVLSFICFKDMMLNKKSNKKFLEVGISFLNQSNVTIKNCLKELNSFDLDFLNVDDQKYNKFTEDEKNEFDKKSALLCLMLKKEFGEFNFLKLVFIKEKSLDSINKIYGFKDDEFFYSSKRYFIDLKNSLKNETFSNRYLNIERSKK